MGQKGSREAVRPAATDALTREEDDVRPREFSDVTPHWDALSRSKEFDLVPGSVLRIDHGHEYTGHTSGITCMATHEHLLFTAGVDGDVRVWNVATHTCDAVLRGHTSAVTCLGKVDDVLVSGGEDGVLRLWDVSTDESIGALEGHTGSITCLAALSGGFVCSGSADKTVRVWNLETGECVHTLTGHTGWVTCLCTSGERLYTGSDDYTVRVWDITTGECVATMEGHTGWVKCMKIDGNRLYTGGADRTLRVWSVALCAGTAIFKGHTLTVTCLDSFQNHVVTGSADGNVRVWMLNDRDEPITTKVLSGHTNWVCKLKMWNGLIVSGSHDRTVRIWDCMMGDCLKVLGIAPEADPPALTRTFQASLSDLDETQAHEPPVYTFEAPTLPPPPPQQQQSQQQQPHQFEFSVHEPAPPPPYEAEYGEALWAISDVHMSDGLVFACASDGAVRMWSVRDFIVAHPNRSIVSLERLLRTDAIEWIDLSNNSIMDFPADSSLPSLRYIDLSRNFLNELPASLLRSRSLQIIKAGKNRIESIGRCELPRLRYCDLSENSIVSMSKTFAACGNLRVLLLYRNALASLPSTLRMPKLQHLDLSRNQLRLLPDTLSECVDLRALLLAHNKIDVLQPRLCSLTRLDVLDIDGLPLQTPPAHVTCLGVAAVLGYLRDLESSASPCSHVRVMVLGEESAGKTTLVRALLQTPNRILGFKDVCGPYLATDGIDIQSVELELGIDDVIGGVGQWTNAVEIDDAADACRAAGATRAGRRQGSSDNIGSGMNASPRGLKTAAATLQGAPLSPLSTPSDVDTLPADTTDATAQSHTNTQKAASDGRRKNPRTEALQLRQEMQRKQMEELGRFRAQRVSLASTHGGGRGSVEDAAPDASASGSVHTNTGRRPLSPSSSNSPMSPSSSTESGSGPSSPRRTNPLLSSTATTATASSTAQTSIEVRMWDFAGQEIFHASHLFFMSEGAVFLLVWDAVNLPSHSRVGQWLALIAARVPSARVVIAATHVDDPRCTVAQLTAGMTMLDSILSKHAQNIRVVSRVFVSSKTGEGVGDLRAALSAAVSSLDHVKTLVPTKYVLLDSALASHRTRSPPVLSFDEFASIGSGLGIDRADGIRRAATYLHNVGSIVWFDVPGLRHFIVAEPRFLVDVFSSVVSFRHNFFRNGGITHDALARLWFEKGYGSDLLPFALSLFRRFGLSFKCEDAGVEVFPCRLPDGLPPESWWPPHPDATQRQLAYELVFGGIGAVPPGLFPQLIARLQRVERPGLYHARHLVYLDTPDRVKIELLEAECAVVVCVRGPTPGLAMSAAVSDVHAVVKQWYPSVEMDVRAICSGCLSDLFLPPNRIELPKKYRRQQKTGLITGTSAGGDGSNQGGRGDCAFAPGSKRAHHTHTHLNSASQSASHDGLEFRSHIITSEKPPDYTRSSEVVVCEDGHAVPLHWLFEGCAAADGPAGGDKAPTQRARQPGALQADIEATSPRYFVMLPDDAQRTWGEPRSWFGRAFSLHLLCEYPNEQHFISGHKGYPVIQPREFMCKYAGHIALVMQIVLKSSAFVVPGLIAASDLVPAEVRKLGKDDLAAFKHLGDVARDIRADAGSTGFKAIVDGARGRALESFLRKADEGLEWAGLQRVRMANGEIMWLCEHHAHLVLPPRRSVDPARDLGGVGPEV